MVKKSTGLVLITRDEIGYLRMINIGSRYKTESGQRSPLGSKSKHDASSMIAVVIVIGWMRRLQKTSVVARMSDFGISKFEILDDSDCIAEGEREGAQRAGWGLLDCDY